MQPQAEAQAAKHTVRFLFIAGMGGIRNRRGGDIVLEAYALARREAQGAGDVALDFYSVRHPAEYDQPVAPQLLSQEGLQLHVGPLQRRELSAALRDADAVLYPSRWEGLGLSLLEALHVGVPALVTDGWPMKELIEHGHNGLLVPAAHTGWFHMAPTWEVSPRALADGMLRLAASPTLLNRMRCPSPGELAARQHAFVMRSRALVLGEAPARILSLAAPPHPHYRRAEYIRSDALRRHGYEVLDVSYDDDWQVDTCCRASKTC